MDILESLCIIFLVRLLYINVAQAILKESKVYFYDSRYVKGGEGLRLENTCAACLLKHVHYIKDTTGEALALNHLRVKDCKKC